MKRITHHSLLCILLLTASFAINTIIATGDYTYTPTPQPASVPAPAARRDVPNPLVPPLQQQPEQQQQPVEVPAVQPKPSLTLADGFDDELLRCPAVEFQAKLKEKDNGRYQITFAPDNDVQWVIAHYQVNDGDKQNVPLKLRDDGLSQRDESSRLAAQEELRHLMSDMNDFNEEFDLDHDLFDNYSRRRPMTQRRRRSYGIPALLASSAPAASYDDGGRISDIDNDDTDMLSLQSSRPAPSLSVSGSSNSDDNAAIMSADQAASRSHDASPRNQFRRSRSSRRRGGSSSGSFESDGAIMAAEEKKSFVSKQIKLARAMIAMKEGSSAGSDGNVGVWIHDAPFELGQNDIVRVWFTYRATKEAPHVDCDSHSFLFDVKGLAKKGVSTKVAKRMRATDTSSSSLPGAFESHSSSAPLSIDSMRAMRVPGSPSPFRQRRQPRAGSTTTFAEEERDPNESADVCAQANGTPSLALTYPELALSGEKNSYTLVLNVTSPSNIRWVDVHYLSTDSKLVNLRMTPLPSAAPTPYRLSQSFQSSSSPSALRSMDIDFTKPHWVRVDDAIRRRGQLRGAFTMDNKPKSGTSDDDDNSNNGASVTADGQFIFTGSFNASDIDKIQIDPSTQQPTSLSIGKLDIKVNVVGMPGSSFVIAKSDDSSDLRHWKDMNKKQKQLQADIGSGINDGDDDDDDDDITDDDYDRLSRSYDREYDRDQDHTSDDRFVHELSDLDDDIRARAPRQGHRAAGGRLRSRLPGAYIGGPGAAAPYPGMRPGYGRPGYGPYPGFGPYPGAQQLPSAGEEEESDVTPATVGPQLFAHPQSLLLGEGDKIRVFFTFFAPPTYCRTKSFSLIAPAIVHTDTTPSTPVAPPAVTPAATPSATPSSPSNATGSNSTAAAMESSPSMYQVPAEYRLYMGRVLPGQFRSRGGRSYGGSGSGGGYGGRRYGRGGGQRRGGGGDYGDEQDDESQQDDSSSSSSDDYDQQYTWRRQYPSRRRRTQYGGLNDDSSRTSDASTIPMSSRGRGRGRLVVAEPSLRCEQVANFNPWISMIKGLTNSAEDQNNYAINFASPKNAIDAVKWVDVHYQKNDDVQRNYRMEQRALGEFEHIEPGWNEGINLVCKSSDKLKYSFTFALGGEHHTECNTQEFNYNPCGSPSPMRSLSRRKAAGGRLARALGAMRTSMMAPPSSINLSGHRAASPAMPSPRINAGSYIPSPAAAASISGSKKKSSGDSIPVSSAIPTQHIEDVIAMNPSLLSPAPVRRKSSSGAMSSAAFTSSSPSSPLHAQPVVSPLLMKVLSPSSEAAAAAQSSSRASSPSTIAPLSSAAPAAAAPAPPSAAVSTPAGSSASPSTSTTTNTQSSSSAAAAAALQQQQLQSTAPSSSSPSAAASNNNNPPYVAVPPSSDASKPTTASGNVPSLTSSTTSLAPNAAAAETAPSATSSAPLTAPITAATLATSTPLPAPSAVAPSPSMASAPVSS